MIGPRLRSLRHADRDAFHAARKARGLTQMEAASLAGLSQTLISDLETGRNTNPSWDVLSKLS